MALTAGTRLGSYEIVSAIGAGGMGEVYKARDVRLDRPVALKVIQSAFASSPEMRERFEREARAISALDHPHICVLYDICREADVSFLVMQYLEGETLADRLARAGKPLSDPSRPSSGSVGSALSTMTRGPIPFETALRHAIEIAEALDAAHRRGIVHRDLKPGNVMLTKAGTKLLDFGLAKLAAGEGTGVFGDGATRTSPFDVAQGGPLTGQGAILGTLHYMSPEQLEGREVDARSDIFAFGALLYEMLTGRRVFEGQSQASIIAAIIGGDPPSVQTLADPRTTLSPMAQRALDRLLARCLAKNPDDRWQSAADLAAELQWINEERLRAVPEATGGERATGPDVSPRSRRGERVWMGIAAAAAVALAAVAYWWYPRATPPADPISFTIPAPDGFDFSPGPGLLSVSPDGRRLAYTTGASPGTQLWVRTLGSLDVRRLERADGAWHLFWSPDSRFIGFAGSGTQALRAIDLAGGSPRTVAEDSNGRAAWSPLGVILFRGADGKLYRVPDAGGQPTVAMELDAPREESSLDWPMFLPDGRRYVFLARSSVASNTGLFLATLDAPGRTFLVNALSNVDYANGYLFYQLDGTLMAHPFDAEAGRLTGDAIPAREDIRYNPGNGRGAFSVSQSGVLAYVPGSAMSFATNRRLTLVDGKGKAIREIGAPGSFFSGVLSPDRRQIVATSDEAQASANRLLWQVDVDRGVATRFTAGDVDERAPIWSPDGAWVVFQSRRDGTYGIYRRSAAGGAATAELLFSSPQLPVPTGFSPDGQHLLMSMGTGGPPRIWVLPLTGDRKPVLAFPGPDGEGGGSAVFSPDGKWIAYAWGASPTDSEIYIRPYPIDDRRIKISTGPGRFAHWTSDGRRVIYRRPDGAVMSVELIPDGGTLRPAVPIELFTIRSFGRNGGHFSMDSRAEQFVFVTLPDAQVEESAKTPITVVVNWTATLGRK